MVFPYLRHCLQAKAQVDPLVMMTALPRVVAPAAEARSLVAQLASLPAGCKAQLSELKAAHTRLANEVKEVARVAEAEELLPQETLVQVVDKEETAHQIQ